MRHFDSIKIALLSLALLAGCATNKPAEEAFDPEAQGATDRVLHYQNALKAAPDDPELHYRLGNALLDMGRHQDAYYAYQKAIQHKPDYADAYANLGLALRKIGNLKAAAGAYVHALDLKPDDLTTLNNLAVVAQLMEDWERMAWCYERMVKLEPDDLGLLAGYADLLHQLGRIDEALPLYAVLAARGQDAVRSQYRVGLCYFDLGRWREAADAWEKALAMAPDNPGINRGLAVAYWEAGDLPAARTAAARCEEKGIALDPEFIRQLDG